MQRILHVLGKMDRAGAETMVMNIYRTIDKSQYQFDFVVFSEKEGDYDSEIREAGGKMYKIAEPNPLRRMLVLKKLLKTHPEYKIIHCHTLFSNAFHLAAARMARVPYRLAHSHNTSDHSKNKLVGAVYQAFARKAIRRYATHFLACGVAASDFLFTKKTDSLILANAIDADYFTTVGEEKKDYLNDLFGLDDACLKVIQVGRLQAVKNHSFSLKIASELKSRGVCFKMFFVGQGPLQVELVKEAQRAGLQKEVVFLGVREDIPQLMAGADAMLMPSVHEGFPVVLVEAQAAGLPSLISDTISKEVDLGLGLVEFASLHQHAAEWAGQLLKQKQKIRSHRQHRFHHLVQRGFDIHANTRCLFRLYNSLK
jgi:glycosyltransferase EpsF